MRDIGKNIRALRMKKNMTQDALAEALFVTRQTVSNYETGRSCPDIEMLLQIAQVLETDANTLLYGPAVSLEKRDRRALVRLIAGAVVFALLLTGFLLLRSTVNELLNRRYLSVPAAAMTMLYAPVLGLSFGWLLMQGIGVLSGIKPLNYSWIRYARRGLIILLAGVLLFFSPLIFEAFYSCRVLAETGSYSMQLPQLYGTLCLCWLNFCSRCSFAFPLLGGLVWLFGFPTERSPVEGRHTDERP